MFISGFVLASNARDIVVGNAWEGPARDAGSVDELELLVDEDDVELLAGWGNVAPLIVVGDRSSPLISRPETSNVVGTLAIDMGTPFCWLIN